MASMDVPSPPVPVDTVTPVAKPRQLMRQYDLVERVRAYDPDVNEDLLNRAYVFSMQAHGMQLRASGDPYFSHPLEVAGILTDMKVDSTTIAPGGFVRDAGEASGRAA